MSADMFMTIRTPCAASQTVAYTGTAGSIAAPLAGNPSAVLVLVTTHAYVRISFGAAATAATVVDIPVAAGIPMVIPINPPTSPGTETSGKVWVSAIQFASGGSLIAQPLQA